MKELSIGLDNNPLNRYVVYSKDDCPFCVKAIELLIYNNLPYTEYKHGVHFTKETLRKKCEMSELERLTVPQIFYNGKRIGGCGEFEKYLEDTGHGGGFGDGPFI